MESELIKVVERDGQKVVSARDLYEGVGLEKAHWSRWSKQNIEEDKFFNENEDWVGLTMVVNGNETKDYAISLEFAKHIAMMARTARSREYRNYFLQCEKIAKEVIAKEEVYIPKTYPEALMLAAQQAQQIEEQQKQIEVMKPKEEFFDAVADSKDAVSMNDVAKVLNVKGMGRNNLFEFLRNEKILMQSNRPYQKYIDCGYFRVVEQRYTKNFEECINFKTIVYQKGINYIRKLLKERE